LGAAAAGLLKFVRGLLLRAFCRSLKTRARIALPWRGSLNALLQVLRCARSILFGAILLPAKVSNVLLQRRWLFRLLYDNTPTRIFEDPVVFTDILVDESNRVEKVIHSVIAELLYPDKPTDALGC
jgi:hypothetical protein